ncbi:MAG: Hsp20/alpha crystallin family protein [Sandaracinaceae bacterium]
MTPPRRSGRQDGPTGREAVDQIEARLTDLFGPVTGSLGAAIAALRTVAEEAEKAGGTSVTVDTGDGPARARASLSVRVGGIASDETAESEHPTDAVQTPRSTEFETYEDGNEWVLVADLPGVREADLNLSVEGRRLIVEAGGRRTYRFAVAAPRPVAPADVRRGLGNGVLELRLPLSRQGEST